ncbi:helix-turn-helix transcriptional regulator [Ensifer sp. IC4062]|nr:AraC family transcriptional regulator [Ensifer sp. IC4062]MCA1443964.1 helix-turn-helix transcriptional regulator [Ensifer sp. IC4062]
MKIAKLLEEAGRHVDLDVEAVRSFIYQAHAIVTGKPTTPQPASRAAGLAPWQIKRVENYVGSNMDRSIHTEDLAQICRLSASHFSKAFKQSLGVSPYAYVLSRRMARAKELLLCDNEPLAQIALECGMYDQAHFSRLFRQFTGETPSRWRRSQIGPVRANVNPAHS